MRDAKNQPNESESARRAGSLAEPHRGTVPDVSHDDSAHDRHDEEAARRQELDLDNPQPLDASRNLAERVRATFTAEADAAEAGAGAGADAAEANAEACGGGSPSWTCRRARRGEVNAHPSGARAAADETIRARPRSRAASSASAQRRAQTSWARSGRRRAGHKSGQSPPRQRARGGEAQLRGSEGAAGSVRACVRTHSLNTGIKSLFRPVVERKTMEGKWPTI